MREDKQFFNGVIVGAILMSFVVASAVLYAIKPAAPQKQLPLPRSWAQQPETRPFAAKPQPAFAHIDLGVGQSFVIDGQDSVVLAAIAHPQTDMLVRLSGSGESSREDCLGGDMMVSIWSHQGQRLDHYASLTIPTEGCFKLIGWGASTQSLVFSETSIEGKNAFQRVWFYDVKTMTLSEGYSYALMTEADQLFHIWSYEHSHLVQTYHLLTGKFSPLFRVEGEGKITEDWLQDADIAVTTHVPVKSDLLLDGNIASYQKGLTMQIGQKTSFIPWKAR